MDEYEEDEAYVSGEVTYPVGTEVAVLRVDGKTFVGYGVIDAWLPFSQIPENEEGLADTDRIGVPAVQAENVTIFCDDGSTTTMKDALEEILEEDDWKNARIRLENGLITYGFRCYYQLRSEYDENINN